MTLHRRLATSRSPAPLQGRGGGGPATPSRWPDDGPDPRGLDDAADPSAGAGSPWSAAQVMDLQRLAGNAAVGGYLSARRPSVQRFLGFPLGGLVPAHPVAGLFAGALTASEAQALDQAIAGIAGADPPAAVAPPGSPAETIEPGDGRRLDLGYLAAVDGPWGDLASALRGLLDGLTDRPLSAIALEVADDETRARIVHRGSESLEVDLSALRIAVLAWQGYYEPAGTWERGPLDQAGGGTVGPGWATDLPFGHGLPTGDGYALQVAVDFALRTHGDWRRVGVVRVPVIDPP